MRKLIAMSVGLLVPVVLCSNVSAAQAAAHSPVHAPPDAVDSFVQGKEDSFPSGNRREPVILSTDLAMGLTTGNRNGIATSVPDIDDAYAFALAVAQRVDLRGVVVTMGNSLVEPSMVTARATRKALRSRVPVVQGADVWLPVLRQEETGGADLTDTCVNDGVRFMADQLHRTRGLTILAIGPLTDVACLAMNYPAEAAHIKRVVALVGSKPTTPLELFGHPAVDFNYIMDPRAEAIVLEQTSIPFTAINFELSSLAPIPLDRLREMATDPDPLARYFGRSSRPLVDELAANGFPAKPVFDAAVVWHLVRPESHVCHQVGFRLKTGSPAITQAVDDNVTDWFSPEFTNTRQVTACTGFTSAQAEAEYRHAVLAAVHADSSEG
ncbi:nucleoside hydrolase [Streptomyces actuosus]|uniref:Nucleoside hydrolase n=1 Tax=Streptomyces actuosus TaxID=1885 RepID=A0ABS2VZL3_STRAS|nr:nucleoside hydrolase [Streptomyces actuosus]MBN0048425.1 nucleoside hydrolase [Streptomyces actuosus]